MEKRLEEVKRTPVQVMAEHFKSEEDVDRWERERDGSGDEKNDDKRLPELDEMLAEEQRTMEKQDKRPGRQDIEQSIKQTLDLLKIKEVRDLETEETSVFVIRGMPNLEHEAVVHETWTKVMDYANAWKEVTYNAMMGRPYRIPDYPETSMGLDLLTDWERLSPMDFAKRYCRRPEHDRIAEEKAADERMRGLAKEWNLKCEKKKMAKGGRQ